MIYDREHLFYKAVDIFKHPNKMAGQGDGICAALQNHGTIQTQDDLNKVFQSICAEVERRKQEYIEFHAHACAIMDDINVAYFNGNLKQ